MTKDQWIRLAQPVAWDSDAVDALSKWSEHDLLNPRGLTLRTYSTVKMLTANPNAHADRFHKTVSVRDVQFAIEELPVKFWHLATAQGVRPSSVIERDLRSIYPVLKDALDTIRLNMPGLFASIKCLLRSLLLLESHDPDYDVSFTLPQLPHSIFVSVPDATDRCCVPRVAEAIVHEVLHLQLALIERQCPLVRQDVPVEVTYAPWCGEERPLSGVVHGLFVFRGIEHLWCSFLWGMNRATREFAMARTEEVRQQRDLVQRPEAFNSLTAFGRRVFQRLIEA